MQALAAAHNLGQFQRSAKNRGAPRLNMGNIPVVTKRAARYLVVIALYLAWSHGVRLARKNWILTDLSRLPSRKDGIEMPLYMDIHHHVDGLTAEAVKGAHEADLATQEEFNVRYLQYWFDEGSGRVFCLVEAPSAEAAAEVHRRAHGLVADEITEVKQGS